MSDIFSFSRFGLLFRKHLKENLKNYLLFTGMLWGILFALQGFVTVMGFNHGFSPYPYLGIFIMTMLFGGAIFSSMFYSFFQSQAKGIHFFQLPASRIEKLLVGFIVTQIFFIIIYLVCYYSVNYIMCALYNSFSEIPKNVSPEMLNLYKAKVTDITSFESKSSIVFFFILSSISHFGSLSFNKNAFVKTALFILPIGIFLTWFSFSSITKMIGGDVMPRGAFFSEAVRIGSGSDVKGYVLLPNNWITFINYFLPITLFVLFWLGCFFKLKEKQV
ncbi:hypothetical protein ACI6Q2_00600 [Chitinophagaceae bacterium LWZ2-11]